MSAQFDPLDDIFSPEMDCHVAVALAGSEFQRVHPFCSHSASDVFSAAKEDRVKDSLKQINVE